VQKFLSQICTRPVFSQLLYPASVAKTRTRRVRTGGLIFNEMKGRPVGGRLTNAR
jgi:hypothetical protein